jgi:transglutaminase-like putative cysteine protease
MNPLGPGPIRASFLYLARYRYTGDVLENDNFFRVSPATDEGQVAEHDQFLTLPGGSEVVFTDAHGNQVRRVLISESHRDLVIASAGRVRIFPLVAPLPDIPITASLTSTSRFPDLITPSPLVDPDALADLAHELAGDARSLLTLVERVVGWVHANISYRKGVTTVSTSAQDVLESRQGVCQDISHVTLGLLRALWVPCRYVSGLLTGETGETHAWIEFWHPDVGWVPSDPTRNVPFVLRADHVKFAAGRDYTDVAPINGAFSGHGTGEIDRVVAEARIEEETQTIEQAMETLTADSPAHSQAPG